MNIAQLDVLQKDDEFYADLGSNIWLMDNHKWAFYVWNKFHLESGIPRFSLIHADHHWDGGNDFHEAPEEEKEFLNASDERLIELLREEMWIRWDSFISPAIIRGFIDEVHFFCKQDDDFDVGISEELLSRSGTKQFIHEDIRPLVSQKFSSPLIFDLCLDLFNKSDMWYQGDIWPQNEIDDFLETTKPLIQQARLITVSLSFGYSGTEDETRQLAKHVLPRLEQWRQAQPMCTS